MMSVFCCIGLMLDWPGCCVRDAACMAVNVLTRHEAPFNEQLTTQADSCASTQPGQMPGGAQQYLGAQGEALWGLSHAA